MFGFRQKKKETNLRADSDPLDEKRQSPAVPEAGTALVTNDIPMTEASSWVTRSKRFLLDVATLSSISIVVLWLVMAYPRVFSGGPSFFLSKYMLYVQSMWLWFFELTFTSVTQGIHDLIFGWPIQIYGGAVVYCWATIYYPVHVLRRKDLSKKQKLVWFFTILIGQLLILPIPLMYYWLRTRRTSDRAMGTQLAAHTKTDP